MFVFKLVEIEREREDYNTVSFAQINAFPDGCFRESQSLIQFLY